MAITYDQTNNKITVTGYTEGTPCNFNNLYTADIGATNGRDLLDGAIDADPDTFSLDSQPAPADSLAVPLKITCTARAGATCDIAGTDAWGNALTENGIDISSGSATTTKRFATVDASGIAVNGMTNGDDFDIKQDRWGVVSKQGNSQFGFDCKVYIGDGSIETWFKDTKKQLEWNAFQTLDNQYAFYTHSNSHSDWGTVKTVNKKTSKDGCYASAGSPSYNINFQITNVYSSCFTRITNRNMRIKPVNRIWNCHFNDMLFGHAGSSSADLYNIWMFGASWIDNVYALSIENVFCLGNSFLDYLWNDNYIRDKKGVTAIDITRLVGITAGGTKHTYFLNFDSDNWDFWWRNYATTTGRYYRQYELELVVQDKNENKLSGATAYIWDSNNDLITIMQTNANGRLVEEGTATSGSASTVADNTKSWATDNLKDFWVKIISGTGSGQTRRISSHTSDTLTVAYNWIITPDATSQYEIIPALNYGYYYCGGSYWSDTQLAMQTPHIIKIIKAGYETYGPKKFTVNKKIDRVIKLKHSNVCVDQEVMLA